SSDLGQILLVWQDQVFNQSGVGKMPVGKASKQSVERGIEQANMHTGFSILAGRQAHHVGLFSIGLAYTFKVAIQTTLNPAQARGRGKVARQVRIERNQHVGFLQQAAVCQQKIRIESILATQGS